MGIAQSADEYEASKSDPNEVWIKGFREGETRVRFLIEPEQAKTYLEHYADGFGYFPCNRERDCVGCTDESAKVRQKSRKWLYNALNDRGHQQVYKLGTKLHEALKLRKQRPTVGTLKDRDYLIIRSGRAFNEISYQYEPGEQYGVQFTGTLIDVNAILEAKYREAAAAYGTSASQPAAAAAPEQEWRPAAQPAQYREAEVPQQPKQDPWMPPTNGVPMGEPDWANGQDEAQNPPVIVSKEEPATGFNPDKASTAELRDYLQASGVDFPARAPRSRLVTMAEENLAKSA